MYFPQLFTSVSWGCTIHQDMASLDGLQGGLKELLGENLRCTESRFALNLALATRNAEACPDVFNNMSGQFNLERRSWCWYVQFLLLLCVWCRASWEGWGKKLTSKVAAISDIVRQRRNWSNISFMCKTHMLWSRARRKGISGCILKRFFILSLAEHSACGHQRRYSTARLASDLEDVH